MADTKIDSYPAFTPKPAGNRLQDMLDQEIDAAVMAFPNLPRDEAVKAWRLEIRERIERKKQREAARQQADDEREQQRLAVIAAEANKGVHVLAAELASILGNTTR